MPTIARAPLAVLPNAGMSQSSVMVGALLAGFVVWLGMQGKLATYWSILIGGGGSGAPATTTTTPPASTVPGTAPGNTGAQGTLVQPQGPTNLVPGAGLQLTPGMQGN